MGLDREGPVDLEVDEFIWRNEIDPMIDRGDGAFRDNHIRIILSEERNTLGWTKRDGTVVVGSLSLAEDAFAEAEESAKAAAGRVRAVHRLEPGSDLGTNIRGFKRIPPELQRRYSHHRDRITGLKARLARIVVAKRLYEAHCTAKAAARAREMEKKRQDLLKADLKEYINLVTHTIPVEVPRAIDAVMNNYYSVTASINDSPAMPYVIGRAWNDLPVLRRSLIERGVPETDLPPIPPKITVPPGFIENLEKILGRKLHRLELTARNPKLKRLQRHYENIDAISKLRELERGEQGKRQPERSLTYRRKPQSGSLICENFDGGFFRRDGRRSAKAAMIEFRPGDTIQVTSFESLPGYPNSTDGWEKIEEGE